MADTAKGNFDSPDEVRPISKGNVEVVNLGGQPVMRATFQPGWKWTTDMKPIAGTDTCQVAHMGYMVSGKITCKMDDGTEFTCGPGEVVFIAPGHDAWVEGDEPAVFIDFQGAANYALPQATSTAA